LEHTEWLLLTQSGHRQQREIEMDSAKLNDWMQVVGIFAVVASLIFVGLQMRQDQEIAQAQALVDASAVVIDLNQFIENNKEVWIKGLDGAELSLEDNLTFRALCRANFLRKNRALGARKKTGCWKPGLHCSKFRIPNSCIPRLAAIF